VYKRQEDYNSFVNQTNYPTLFSPPFLAVDFVFRCGPSLCLSLIPLKITTKKTR